MQKANNPLEKKKYNNKKEREGYKSNYTPTPQHLNNYNKDPIQREDLKILALLVHPPYYSLI